MGSGLSRCSTSIGHDLLFLLLSNETGLTGTTATPMNPCKSEKNKIEDSAMKPKKSAVDDVSAATSRPARSPEAQENYMINLAMKLVEKRLLEGTASSAETTHFLKLATSKNELEKAKLEEENKLLRAKTETLQNAKHSEEMYGKVIAAMKKYNGLGEDDEYDGI